MNRYPKKPNVLRKFSLALAMAVGSASLAGCALEYPEPQVDRDAPATVIAREERDGYTRIQTDGVRRKYPPTFEIEVEQCEVDNSGKTKNEPVCVTDVFYVDEETFSIYPEGSDIIIGKIEPTPKFSQREHLNSSET